jgi:predicted DsbA family dithiol-disulfide isomerase
MAKLDVDIVSDFVCPWCWLGWKQFRKSGVAADVVFRPYLLDPLVPKEGRPYRDYMKAKFGEGDERFKAMREHLEAAGPSLGIHFKFSELTVRPNTLAAHRLMRWAQGQDLGIACAEALFKAYFEELRDIGDVDVLVAIAGEIGLDGDLVSELLESERDADAVNEEIDFFRRLGVSGVPTFIYNGEQALQGAQDADTHKKMAKAVKARREL